MKLLATQSIPALKSVSLSMMLGFSIVLMIAGCNRIPPVEWMATDKTHSIISRLEAEGAHGTAPDTGETARPDVNIEHLLTEFVYVAVQTPSSETEGENDLFYTLARRDQLNQYPCSTCHIAPLVTLQSTVDTPPAVTADQPQRAHWDITLNHADETVMNCLTCHTTPDMDNLHTLTGQTVDFDHSYQVCAQCHGQQLVDWQGGAHGKRIGGWAPPRVINNCVNCHNPHQPAWDTRWPAVTNAGQAK